MSHQKLSHEVIAIAGLISAAPYLQSISPLASKTNKTIKQAQRHLPSNNRNPQKRAQDAKYQRHNAPGREAIRNRRRRQVLARQIEQIERVARGVAGRGDGAGGTGGEVIGWYGKLGGLQGERGLDHGGDETAVYVPFYVAVEEPDAWEEMSVWFWAVSTSWGKLIWIICFEAEDDVTLRVNHEGISAHGHAREGGVVGVVAGIFLGADDSLEVVSV